MSGVVDRITEVLERHRPYGLDCKCGEPINSDAGWARHATAAVQAALGLTEEWAVQYSEPIAYSKARNEPPSDEILERTKRFFPGRIWVSRFVTGWLPSQSGDTP